MDTLVALVANVLVLQVGKGNGGLAVNNQALFPFPQMSATKGISLPLGHLARLRQGASSK